MGVPRLGGGGGGWRYVIPPIVPDRLPAPADLLPHRPPFLFVDEILALAPGESARARWRVDPGAAFFAGHFPGNPILPGVILVEALAQTGALAALAEAEAEGKLVLFAGIERTRFRRVVRPGEDVILETRITRRRGLLGEGEARRRSTASSPARRP